jgi:manganese transport protein
VRNKLTTFLRNIAPGLFIVGYVIGTGSITSMVVAGARFGMSLAWALLLSCIFTFVLLVAISKLTIVTGQTILYTIKQQFGKFTAIFIIVGLMVTVITSISSVMGVVTEVIQKWSVNPEFSKQGIPQWATAMVFLGFLLYLFWTAQHGLFLRFVSVMVAVMGFAFVLSNFLIVQDPTSIIQGLIPRVPQTGKPHIVIAGIVGTTMAAVVLVSRSSIIAEKGWKVKDLKIENRDAFISALVTFLVSAAIMASAAGTLFHQGIQVENAIEMVNTLKPLAGRFAVAVFVTGIIAAGLSSIFPNMVLLPWLISDYTRTPRDMKRPLFRFLAILVSLTGLLIPVFGGSPVAIMIASQAFSPLMIPLLIILLFILLNRKKVMGEYTNGVWLNAGLLLTLAFSLFIFFVAAEGYKDYFYDIWFNNND